MTYTDRPRLKTRKLQIMVYMTPDLIERIEAQSYKSGLSRSAYIQMAMDRFVKLAESQPEN